MNPGDQPQKSIEKFRTKQQDRPLLRESAPSPDLPPKEPGSQKHFLKNFRILNDDPTTKEIFNSKPLCVYRRDTSLRGHPGPQHFLLVWHCSCSSEPPGTFAWHRPLCHTCDFRRRTATVTSADGGVHLKGRFNCTEASIVYVIVCTQGVHWRNWLQAFLPFWWTPAFSGGWLHSVEGVPRGWLPHSRTLNLPNHSNIQDMRVSVVRKVNHREEKRLIFQLKTLSPSGFNFDFTFNIFFLLLRLKCATYIFKRIHALVHATITYILSTAHLRLMKGFS